jgi:hypothetical protein
LGYILGDFFTNSSGHPGCAQHLHAAPAKSHQPRSPHSNPSAGEQVDTKREKKGKKVFAALTRIIYSLELLENYADDDNTVEADASVSTTLAKSGCPWTTYLNQHKKYRSETHFGVTLIFSIFYFYFLILIFS